MCVYPVYSRVIGLDNYYYICNSFNFCLIVKPLSFSVIFLFFCLGGVYVWPGLAEVNTRARRYVSAWIRHQKREETRLAYIQKVRECVYLARSYGGWRGGGVGVLLVYFLTLEVD